MRESLLISDLARIWTFLSLSGCVDSVWLAPPWSSFSRALHGPTGTSWQRLRSETSPLGVDDLRLFTRLNDTCRAHSESWSRW